MRVGHGIIQLLVFSKLGSTVGFSPIQPQPTAITTNGTVVGFRNAQFDQDFFLGIPYAQPPLGQLRYNHPQPVNETWAERRATGYGDWCHSLPVELEGFTQTGFPHKESEDCLTVNIIRPSGVRQDTGLPVLVCIYGGGFQEGGTADQRYNMSFLVQEPVHLGKPILGVSFNYRLSGFGFLASSDFRRSGILNLGLYDQRLALHWIQDNIAAFGGDPSKVTIQGESAGAISVGLQFIAYGGRDDSLFRAGIGESGTPLIAFPTLSLQEQDIMYDNVLNQTNCVDAIDAVQCLRSIDAETLKAAFRGPLWGPVIDGNLLVDSPAALIKEGRFVKRPLLIGTNTNEGTPLLKINGGTHINTAAEFESLVASWPGLPNETAVAVVEEYVHNLSDLDAQNDLGTVLLQPGPDYGSLYGKASLYQGDIMFTAPRRLVTESWAHYRVPVFSYRFNVVPNGYNPSTLGAAHFAEIPFVFRNFDGIGFSVNRLDSNSTQVRQNYLRVSDTMSRTFLNFVTGLSPNAKKVPGLDFKWPIWTNKSPVNLVFNLDGPKLERDNFRESQIAYLINVTNDFRL